MTLELRRPSGKAQAKEAEEAERKRKVRDSLVLCMHHMISLGYIDSAERLAQEAGFPTDRYELCDNMNLLQIITDFEAFQELKYGQKPKLTKLSPKQNQTPQRKQGANLPPLSSQDSRPGARPRAKMNPGKPVTVNSSREETLGVTPSQSAPSVPEAVPPEKKPLPVPVQKKEVNLPADVRLMKPIPMQLRADFGDLTSVIARDIFIDHPGVKWSDIVGLQETKRVLREAVVMPLKFPQLFSGKKLLKPWRGVLLHGPPGTGKTMLAKAVAGEGTTFFNVSVSTIVSKWRGDSEKLIRVLFELARYHAPSTIFIDELDAVMSKRSSHDEHER